MGDDELKVFLLLLERQKELIELAKDISEAQYVFAEALCPTMMITPLSDEVPPTLQ